MRDKSDSTGKRHGLRDSEILPVGDFCLLKGGNVETIVGKDLPGGWKNIIKIPVE